MADAEFVPSKAEARRLIRNGGLYLNNQRIVEEAYLITNGDLVGGELMLVALGKKQKVLIEVIE